MTTEPLGIVVSTADEASVHVGERMRALVEFEESVDSSRPPAAGGGTVYRRPGVELRTFDGLHLELEDVATAFDDPRLVAFASRHAGDTGPLLTAHHTGNFGPAEYGGADRALARAAPNAHRTVLAALDDYAPDGYDVGMECTHHGPTDVGVPSLFVEVGSGPEAWADPEAAAAVARAILDLGGVSPDANLEDGRRRHVVGFGGGHYAPRFERIVRETDWAVGHVAADWCLEAMGEPASSTAIIERAFAASSAEYALVEGELPALVATIEDLGHSVVDETWIRETSGVPLPIVEALETALTSIGDGLRLGPRAEAIDGLGSGPDSVEDGSDGLGGGPDGVEGGPLVGAIPADLLAAVAAVDGDCTFSAVRDVALAFDTEQNGTRIAGDVALAERTDEDRLVDSLLAILADGYDELERSADHVVVRRREFDPAAARAAGVTPGPYFGRLADGESVTVDGETVAPADVSTDRKRRLSTAVLPDDAGTA